MDFKRKSKRIGIDARFYGPIGKGLGRYTQEIVDNITNLDEENDYVIFLSKENFDLCQCQNERVKKVLVNINWYSWAEQIIFPFFIWREHLDLIHFPHFNVPIFCPVKFIVTIQDLILTKYPTVRSFWQFYWFKNLSYRMVVRLAMWRAKIILTSSNYTKYDIIDKFDIKAEKILVIYYGIANLNKNFNSLDDEKVVSKIFKNNIINNFILYVGNAYPHKNLTTLLSVFSKFYKRNKNFHLVLVGYDDYFYQQLKLIAKKMNLWEKDDPNSPVIFTGFISDFELDVLYKQAAFYIFPSLYEGFGLPPLEAMSKGCPVLSSNKSSLPEILGEAALYSNTLDKTDMLIKMEKISKDKNFRQELIRRGFEQVKKYNWLDCAKRTLKVYKNILVL